MKEKLVEKDRTESSMLKLTKADQTNRAKDTALVTHNLFTKPPHGIFGCAHKPPQFVASNNAFYSSP